MSAGSTSTTRTTLIRILADVASSIKQLKDLATQLSDLTKAYMYLKHVLGNIVKAYDEVDSVVRRSSDIYARQGMVLLDITNRYGKLSSDIKGAVSVFQQLIRTNGMTEEAMLRLTVQARELSSVLNKSMEDIGRMMRELKVNLGLTNDELERMTSIMGVLSSKTGVTMDSVKAFAEQGGLLAKSFGGTKENAMSLAAAFESATSSAQGAQAMFGRFMSSIQSYGKEFAGLPSFFNKAAQEMLTSPLRAIQTLKEGLDGLTEAERRAMLMSGALSAQEIQYMENLAETSDLVKEAMAVQKREAQGIETVGDIYNRIVKGIGEQMKKLWEDVKNLARGFGEYLVPVLATVIAVFRGFLGIIEAIPGPIKGMIGLVLGLAGAYLAIVKISGLLMGVVASTTGALFGEAVAADVAAIGITGLAGAMLSAIPAAISLTVALLPYIAIAGAIALAIGLVISALGGMDTIMAKLSGAWQSFVKGFSIGFGDATKQFDALWKALASLITPFERGKKGINEMSQGIENFGWWVGAIFKEVADWLHNTIFLIGYTIAWFQDMAATIGDMFSEGGIGGVISGMADLVYNALEGAISRAKKLFTEFLEWVGLQDKSDAKQYSESPEYRAAKARAEQAARDFEKAQGAAAQQQQQATQATQAANSAAGVLGQAAALANQANQNNANAVNSAVNNMAIAAKMANQASQATTAASQSAAVSLQQAAATAASLAAGDSQTAVVPNIQKPAVSFGGTIMPAPARQVAMASTVPIPNIPKAAPEASSSTESPASGGSVPIQIVLDDYILGQALVSINRRMGILGYGDAGGSLHGIR